MPGFGEKSGSGPRSANDAGPRDRHPHCGQPQRELSTEAPVPRAASFGADVAPTDDDVDFEIHKGSPLGTAIVALLLIAALGLVGASVAMKNTPDPRPLLEDLYRQYVKQ